MPIMSKTENDYKELKSELEALSQKIHKMGGNITDDLGDSAKEHWEALSQSAKDAQKMWKERSEQVKEEGKRRIEQTDSYAHDNPWQIALGASALTAIILLLLKRGDK